MKKLKELVRYLSRKPDHEQCKFIANVAHNLALLILVHYFVYGTGSFAIMVSVIALLLWLFAYMIVRKDEE